jgi:hypothetical protein
MTKDKALDLALAALETWKCGYPREWDAFDEEAITAIKQALAAPVQEPVSGYIKKIEDLIQERDDARSSRDFYKRRADALQQWQSKMRDPERTIVCDILANGCTLEPAGDRYTTPPAAQPAPVQGPDYKALYEKAAQQYNELAALMEQPAPVQEPVAQLGDGVLWCDTCRSVQETIHHTSPNDRDVWCKGEAAWLQGPFYTTPPAAQRQWVGLEREIAAAVLDHCYGHGGVSDDMIERTTEIIKTKLKENT